jgi:hypothetical protein
MYVNNLKVLRSSVDGRKCLRCGLSAGAWSVGFHMVAYGGDSEGLFRGGFMHSGSPAPLQRLDGHRGQLCECVKLDLQQED